MCIRDSLYSHAKMYLDWLTKYKFCPGCGSVIYPIDAGTKLRCSNEDMNVKCDVRDHKVNNICFPRTDPVVIIAIVSRDFSKVCIARSKRKYHDVVLYGLVAGFMECSETVEHAAAREIWEETGMKCDEVSMVCTQPWPPVNLMIGCIGFVDFNGVNEKIDLGHDPELAEAQWVDTEELMEAHANYKGGMIVPFRDGSYLPGNTAVAYQLVDYVAEQYKKLQGKSQCNL